MTERKCGTCKYYEPAPIWRKGWCRNPLLYAPHQSHLVSEDDLDCDRGMGNYWEPADEPVQALLEGGQAMAIRSEPAAEKSVVLPLRLSDELGRGTAKRQGGFMDQYTGSGSSRDPEPEDEYQHVPPFTSRPSGTGPFGSERQFTYQTDERYWTDYIRIAAPVLGVILMLGLAWFWISSLLADRGASQPTPEAGSLPTVLTGPTPTTEVTPAGPIIITTVSPSTTPAATQPSGTVGPGATVIVANTDGAGVNLRAAPSTSADIVQTLPEGTELTVVGESISAEGYVWWPVKSGNLSGYVVADYLQPVTPTP